MLEELRELLEEEGDEEGEVGEGELEAVPSSLFRQDSVGLYSCQVRLHPSRHIANCHVSRIYIYVQ